MTTASPTRVALRGTARLGLAGAALVAAVSGAWADDGIGGFLASIFGGNAAPQAASEPRYAPTAAPGPAAPSRRAWREATTFSWHGRIRPLVVRLHPRNPKVLVAEAPVKPGKVSIFEDRTLRRSDAVMMADGVRVFAGSSSWPYAAEDFVRLKDAKDLDRDTSKVLAQLDKLPRG